MDDPARRSTCIDEPALADLERRSPSSRRAPGLRGVIVRSGKRGSFVAGADVERDRRDHGPRAGAAPWSGARTRPSRAWPRCPARRWPRSTASAWAAGSELALACDSRVAAEEPHTQIGLPEVLLGIIPGFGGTTRLPRLVGLSTALDLILTGRTLDARRAERAGLVARAVPGAWLIEHAHRRLAELAARGRAGRGASAQRPPGDRWRPRSLRSWFMDGTPFGRGLTFARARALTQARTGGHYPAPVAALSVLHHGFAQPVEASLRLEAEWVSDLVVGPVCKNLVRVFQLAERARKEPLPGTGAAVAVERLAGRGRRRDGRRHRRAREPRTASRCGCATSTRPRWRARCAPCARASPSAGRPRGRTRGTRPRGSWRASCPALELAGAEPRGPRDRGGGRGPGRQAPRVRRARGAHAARRGAGDQHLLALAWTSWPRGSSTRSASSGCTSSTRSTACRWSRWCAARRPRTRRWPRPSRSRGGSGRTPVVVKDSPGFVVNRVLMPYLREALHLLEDGYRVRRRGRGHAGLRHAHGAVRGGGRGRARRGREAWPRSWAGAFPERIAPAPQLEALLRQGCLGRKSGARLLPPLAGTAHAGPAGRAAARGPRASAGPRASRPSPSGWCSPW